VSMGVATFSSDQGKTAAEWLEQADAALYRAKRLGRNKVNADRALNMAEVVGAQ
jgi:diguanylate cyclase (GGDEF)-like protein